jgi:hypothetical protein
VAGVKDDISDAAAVVVSAGGSCSDFVVSVSAFGGRGSEDAVDVSVVELGVEVAGTELVVSGFSRLVSCLWSPGVGLVVDEGSSGLMSLLLGGSF